MERLYTRTGWSEAKETNIVFYFLFYALEGCNSLKEQEESKMSEDKSEVSPEEQPSGGLDPELVKYINERARNVESYSDKLRKAIEEIDNYLEEIAKQSGVGFCGPAIEHDEEGMPIFLAIDKNYRATVPYWGLCLTYFNGVEHNFGKLLKSASRDQIKKAVPLLPKFLRDYAKELRESEQELKEFSDKAERIANILSE